MTSTELGYLSGVTSNIQTQLDGKANNTDFSYTTNGAAYIGAILSKYGKLVVCTLLPIGNYAGAVYEQTITIPSAYKPNINYSNIYHSRYGQDTAAGSGVTTPVYITINAKKSGSLYIGHSYGFLITEFPITICWRTA